MGESLQLGSIIATRKLTFTHADASVEAVTLMIGVPVSDGADDWICPYLVKAESFQKFFRMTGVDSMQALIHTVSVLQDELSALARKHVGTFQYLDGEDLMLANPLRRSA